MEKDFRIGMPVIVNFHDRPCNALVAIITSVNAIGEIRAQYLNYDIPERPLEVDPNTMTPLWDFGVDIFLYRVEKTGLYYETRVILESVAKYADGEPRPWQEYDHEKLRAHVTPFTLLEDWLKRHEGR